MTSQQARSEQQEQDTAGPYARAATAYRALGWEGVIPVEGKSHPADGFTGREGAWPDDDQVESWIGTRGHDNVALRLPHHVIGIDVDAYGDRRGADTIEWYAEQCGETLPATWRVSSRTDAVSGIYLFRVPAGWSWRSNLGPGSNVDIIRTAHRYAVVAPSIHPETGQAYRWYLPGGQPADRLPTAAELPDLPASWISALTKGTPSATGTADGPTFHDHIDHSTEDIDAIDVDGQPIDVRDLLATGIPIGSQNETLYRYLCSMRARGFKREEMLYIAQHVLGISEQDPNREPWTSQDIISLVDRVRSEYAPGTSGFADQLSPELREFAERVARGQVTVDESPPREALPTDLGNTLRLARILKDVVRYSADENRWYLWDGNRWAPDTTNQILELTTHAIDDIRFHAATIADNDLRGQWMRWALQTETLARRRAMLDGMKGTPGIVLTAEQFDSDPWLLVCRNGTIDLRTGQLRQSNPADLCTRRAEVDFDPAAEAPAWREHIKFISCGRRDVALFLMGAAGYSLTGFTGERSFYFLEGSGSNGKNVFVEPVLDVMGSYAKVGSSSLLTGGDEQHPTILAELRGARLVFIDEVRQGKRLNVERVKALTGSKRIQARRMREDFFEFDAQFKLWIAANGQPTMNDPSDGVWTRMKRVPFDGKLQQHEIKRDFGRWLYEHEAPGILNWLIQGCGYWRDYGLATPPAVLEAVDEHRHSEDDVELFLEDNPMIFTGSSHDYLIPNEVYLRYRNWALLVHGMPARDIPTSRGFGMRLIRKLSMAPSDTVRLNGKLTRLYRGWRFDDGEGL